MLFIQKVPAYFGVDEPHLLYFTTLTAPPREAAVQLDADILIHPPFHAKRRKQEDVIQHIRADGKPIRLFRLPDALL